MAAAPGANEKIIPKRTGSLRLRHTRATSGAVDIFDSSQESESDGLKAVNTVAGAISNFFRWSASPLIKDSKARSFDSIDVASTSAQSSELSSRGSVKEKKKVMDKRRSSGAVTGVVKSPSKESISNTSKEGSPVSAGSRLEVRDTGLSKRDSSPGICFSVPSTDSDVNDGSQANTPARVIGPKKSLEVGDVNGTPTPDISEKSFETSLNSILNKCSETSLDMTSDGKDDKKTDRKKKSQPWYTMLNPTYKSRSEDFKRQFKDIPADERLICDYSCALQKEILVHGRMFVTQSWICFYANIFRWETVVTISMKEVIAITKEKTARVIPNALQVCTDREKYFFTSFTARDKTFMMLFRLWQNALLEQPLVPQELWHWVHSCYGDDLGLTSSDDDYVPPPSFSEGKDSQSKDASLLSKGDSSELIPSDLRNDGDEDGDSTHADISLNSNTNIPAGLQREDLTDLSDTTEDDVSEGEVVCTEHDHFTKLAHNEVYQLPLEKLFELMFTDCEFFRNFVEKARKYSDVTVTPWTDDPDENIGRVREVRYTIPLNAPFGPKTSNTIEKHMCYKQSQTGIMYLIDAECTPLGIPYADAFYVMNRYCLTRVSKESCRLRVTSEVKYRKSVWGVVKSMIERNSMQGVMDYFQCLGIHLRRESEKYQTLHGMPTTSKKKLRKRRSIGVRGVGSIVEPSVVRQLSRSQKSEKLKTPQGPPKGGLLPQTEEGLLQLNADTLVRIICFILILLVMFNALLFYKLWSLEATANVLFLPNSKAALQSLRNNPPKSAEEWIRLLSQQQQLHDAEMSKWQDLLSASITMVDQVKETLIKLKDHVHTAQDLKSSSEATHEQTRTRDDDNPDS